MKRNIAEEITKRILEDLEKGITPWEKPWKAGRGWPFPLNASTKRNYRGINVFLLLGEAQRRGFSCPSWLTFNQAKGLGGNVRKGEKGTQVVFYKKLSKTKSLDLEDEVLAEEQAFWILRTYTVFNLDQVEGLDHLKPKVEPVEPFKAIQEAEVILRGSGVRIVHSNSDRAFYDRQGDFISLPFQESFESPESYYSVVFHECCHASGASHRLNREFGKRFGDQAYAFEELVAEMGAAFLCATAGIPYTTRHSDYIGDWVKVLKDHQRAILTAAAKAQAAVDFLLKNKFEQAAA